MHAFCGRITNKEFPFPSWINKFLILDNDDLIFEYFSSMYGGLLPKEFEIQRKIMNNLEFDQRYDEVNITYQKGN